MKTKIIFATICFTILLTGIMSQAQDSLFNQRIYKAWIKPMKSGSKIKGIFFEVNDSSVVLSNSIYMLDYVKDNFTTASYKYNNIENLRIRRMKNIGKGIGIGFGVGVGVGLIVAAISVANQDNTQSSNTWDTSTDSHASEFIGIPILIGSLGAAAGAIVGSLKVTIPINGDKDEFAKQRKRLERYTLKKSQN